MTQSFHHEVASNDASTHEPFREDLNRALAEAMGGEFVQSCALRLHTTSPFSNGHWHWPNDERRFRAPDYCTDLNALRDGPERMLRESTDWALRVEYDPIAEMYTATWIGPYEHGFTPNAMFATEAEARASAALRALQASREPLNESARSRPAGAGDQVEVQA